MDCQLSPATHVDADQCQCHCRSGYYQLRQLRPVARSLSTDAAFVSSRLDYCNALLYGLSERLLRRVATIRPERRRGTCNWCAAPWTHTSRRFRGDCISCPCDDESNSRSLSWSSSVYPAIGNTSTYLADDCQIIADISMRRFCSTDTAMCAVRRSYNTFGDRCFSQRLGHHACGTHYLLNYDNVTVLESSDKNCIRVTLKIHLFGDHGALWHFS